MRSVVTVVLTFLALSLLTATIAGPHGVIHLLMLRGEIGGLNAKNEELQTKIAETKRKISGLQEGRFDLEKRAREDLGLSKQDEIIYILPPSK